MKLSVVLFTSKTLTDGTHPIMLRLFRKGKYYHKALQISCRECDWNDDEKECRKSFSRHMSFNKIIRDSKYKTQKLIDKMIADEIKFSIDYIFEPIEEKEVKTLIEVVNEHKSQYTKFNTIEKYDKLIRRLKEYGYENLLIDEVDVVVVKTFYNKFKEGRKDTTIYTYMAVFDASLNTAVEKGYIPENPFKYTNFKYDKTTKKRALNRYDIDKLIQYYDFYYSLPSPENSLSDTSSEYFALNIFLSSYYLQGLSLVDLASLKVKDVVFSDKTQEGNIDYKPTHKNEVELAFLMDKVREGSESIDEEITDMEEDLKSKLIPKVPTIKAITIETKRRKTNKNVKIVHRWDKVRFLLESNLFVTIPYEGKPRNPEDYLFNVFNDKCEGNNKYQISRLTYITHLCNTQLKKVKEKLGLNIDELTLYCARHTYASTLYHNGVNSNLIAQNLGRDIRDIEVYLKQFDDEKIINSNDIL